MNNTKKFSNSQLKWLAENLTTQQMAYLMESDEQLQNANHNAGIADMPQNPGMETQTQGSMKPTTVPVQNNTQSNQQNASQVSDKQTAKAQISTVCKAIKGGKLNTIEPQQLTAFMKNANISVKNVGQAIKYAIEFLSVQMKNPKDINMQTMKNTVAGINSCLAVLVGGKNVVSESILSDVRKKGVDVKMISEAIRTNNVFDVMRAGKTLSMINESDGSQSINKQVSEFYSILTQIKNLKVLTEKAGIDMKKFNSIQEMTKVRDAEINESISAIKFAVSYYNKNK